MVNLKNKLWNRIIFCGILSSFLIIMFSGCGGRNSSSSIPTPTPISTETPAPSVTPTPTLTITPTPTASPTPTPVPYTYIISDEGWENGGITWNYNFGATRDTSNPHSGSYALKLTDGNNCEYDCTSSLIPISTNEKFSFWFKGDANVTITIATWFMDNSSNEISAMAYKAYASNTYTEFDGGAPDLPPGTAWIKINFIADGTGTIYVDDFYFGVK